VVDRDREWLYLPGLIVVAGAAIVQGVRFKPFAFVVYGVVYGYIGISARAIRTWVGPGAPGIRSCSAFF
jgi:hypothetical protein